MSLERATAAVRLTVGVAALVLTLVPIALHAATTQESALIPELEILRPFLGSWDGALDVDPDHVWQRRSWIPILKGQAIRDTRAVPEADFEAEAIVFFDREEGVVSYIGITDNGYVTRGEITFEGGEFMQMGDQIMPDGVMRTTRTTCRFMDDGTMIERFWSLEDDEWQAGHSIIYMPTLGDD